MPSNRVRVSVIDFVRVVAGSIDFAIEVIPSPALTECQAIHYLLFGSASCGAARQFNKRYNKVLFGCMSTDEEIRFDTQGVDKVLSLEVPLCM